MIESIAGAAAGGAAAGAGAGAGAAGAAAGADGAAGVQFSLLWEIVVVAAFFIIVSRNIYLIFNI